MKKYINFPIVETKEYRKISNMLIEGKITVPEAKNRIIRLLQVESDFNDNIILQFADIIIENALLRKKEVT